MPWQRLCSGESSPRLIPTGTNNADANFLNPPPLDRAVREEHITNCVWVMHTTILLWNVELRQICSSPSLFNNGDFSGETVLSPRFMWILEMLPLGNWFACSHWEEWLPTIWLKILKMSQSRQTGKRHLKDHRWLKGDCPYLTCAEHYHVNNTVCF